MLIRKLILKNFRNYEDLDIEFNENLNLIIGNNAQGKTNILEAIYYLSITKSFLSISDKYVIKKDKFFSSINGLVNNKDGNKKLLISINNEEKKIYINGNLIKKHADFIGNLNVILFSPNDIKIIKEGPGNRRKFLNIEICQLFNNYINILNEFNIILRQRNEYLKIIKAGKYNSSYFEILNDKYVDLSIKIFKYRNNFINLINENINNVYNNISGYSGLSIRYITSIEYIDDELILKNNLYDKLKKNYNREILYGSSLIGPHRDDFCFLLNESDLLLYGSQGQQKMAVLALKLAEIDVFKKISGEYPVMLLDDLFSELDISKQNKILNFLGNNIQSIITTTDIKNIKNKNIKNANIYKISNGIIIDSKTKKEGT